MYEVVIIDFVRSNRQLTDMLTESLQSSQIDGICNKFDSYNT